MTDTPPGTPPPSRASAVPALAAYAAAFVLALAASQGLVAAVGAARGAGDASRAATEAMAFARSIAGMTAVPAVNGAVLCAIALGAARLRGPGVVGRLRLGPTAAGAPGALAAAVGLLGLSLACGAAVDLLGLGDAGTMGAMTSALRAPSPAQLALAIAGIGVVPGVAEEVFFRGLLLRGLEGPWGRRGAIAASAAAFGLIHVDLVQGAVAFAAGVLLGWCAERLGGARPAIAAHVANNVAFVALASAGGRGPSPAADWAILAAGAAACAAAVAAIRGPITRRRRAPSGAGR